MDNDGIRTAAFHRCKCRIKFIRRMDHNDLQLHTQSFSGRLQLPEKWFCKGITCVRQHGDPLYRGKEVSEEFESLCARFWAGTCRSSDVAPRSGETGDETCSDRIARSNHNDRNFAGCMLRRRYSQCQVGDDDAYVVTNHLSRKLGQQIGFSFGRTNLEPDVATVAVSKIAHSFPERRP